MPKIYEPTQLLKCQYLSERLSKNVYIKMDCNLPSGSFKVRGLSHLIQHSFKQGNTSFVVSSGGNAGLAASFAAAALNAKIDVFIPTGRPDKFIKKLEYFGAKVHIGGANWNECDAAAREFLKTQKNCGYIHPFDDPIIWDGHASVVEEFSEQLRNIYKVDRPDLVVCSVGGGGLYNGIRLGLRKCYAGGDKIPVIAAETFGCDSLFGAVKNNDKDFSLKAITSIATSLGALKVSEQTFIEATTTNTLPILVKDEETLKAMTELANGERVLVEPACAASIAVLSDLDKAKEIFEQLESNGQEIKNIVIEVCGGNLVDLSKLG